MADTHSEEVVRPVRWADVAAVVLVPLVVFGLANASLWGQAFTEDQDYYRTKWELLLAQRQPVDWLILGDSSASCAVDPGQLGEALGGRALNLGSIVWFKTLDDAWMLRQYLARVGPPRHVVVVTTALGLAGPIDTAGLVPLLGHLPRKAAWAAPPQLPLSPLERARVGMVRALPLLAEPVMRYYRQGLPGQTPRNLAPARPDGFTPAVRQTPEFLADRPNDRDVTWQPEPLVEAALRQMSGDAAAHGFELYLAHGPVVADFHGLPKVQAAYRRMDGWLHEVTAGQPATRYLPEVKSFARPQMQSESHPLPAAAAEYTAWLATRLQTARS